MQSLGEILSKIEEVTTDPERVMFLQNIPGRYQGPMRTILKHMFDKNVKFLLPEGAPPYVYKEAEASEAALLYDIRRFYLFIEGGHPTLKQSKREAIFASMLETMIKPDAELFIAMKDKRSPYKGLTRAVVRKAFPDLDI